MKISESTQSKKSELQEKGWSKGDVFYRTDCLDYDKGYGIFTGEWGENCDGPTLKFTDGSEFLWEHLSKAEELTVEIEKFIIDETTRYVNEIVNFVRDMPLSQEMIAKGQKIIL